MTTTVFVNGVTLTDAGWFNDVDLVTYENNINANGFSGIDNTGATSSSAGIAALIAAHSGTGRQITFEGTFKITQKIDLAGVSKLKFSATPGTTINYDITGNGSLTSGISDIFAVDGASYIVIEGFELIATGAAGETGSAAIQVFNDSHHIWIRRNYIHGHNIGITIGDGTYCWVEDNVMTTFQRHCVRDFGERYIWFKRNYFADTSLEIVNFNGEVAIGCKDVFFDSNILKNPGAGSHFILQQNAGTVEPYERLRFTNNIFIDEDNDAGAGFFWESTNANKYFVYSGNSHYKGLNACVIALADDAVVSGNSVFGCRGGGIALAGCQRASITGNTVRGCDTAAGVRDGGIHLTDSGSTGCSGTVVAGNTSTGNDKGLRINSTNSVGVRVGENNFDGNTSNAIFDAGASTIRGLDGTLLHQFTDVSSSGTVETTLATKTISANTLGKNNGIHFVARGTISGTNNTKDVRLKFAGTTLMTMNFIAGNTDDWRIEAFIFPPNNSGFARCDLFAVKGTAVHTSSYQQNAATLTSDAVLSITGQCANAGDAAVLRMVHARYIGEHN